MTKLLDKLTQHLTFTLHELAMQRLEREVRTDGPNAVMAAAAIVLASPQATPVDSPLVEANEAPANVPESHQLTAAQLSTNDLYRMFHEVYSIGELPAIPADASKIREHIEAYFNCSLPTALNMSPRSIGGHLRVIAACSFPVAFESGGHSHMGKIYMVPHPKTRA